MAKETAKTAPMNRQHALHANAEPVPSSAKTAAALLRRRFVMVQTTAAMALTNRTATCLAPSLNSNADQTGAASSTAGNVTVTLTAKTVQMKTHRSVTNVPATRKPNLRVKTAAAYRNYGCAISTTTAATIPMNRRTCAVRGTAQQAGNVVQEGQTTVASRNGCSATGKTTVVIIPTSLRRIARLVILKLILNALIIDAFQSSGSAILLTIAEMGPMKRRSCVKETIGSAPSLSSGAIMGSVFQRGGGAIMKMIVGIIAMRSVAAISSARMERSSVLLGIASRHTLGRWIFAKVIDIFL